MRRPTRPALVVKPTPRSSTTCWSTETMAHLLRQPVWPRAPISSRTGRGQGAYLLLMVMRLAEGIDLPSQLQHVCHHYGRVQFHPQQGVACTHQLVEVGVISFPTLPPCLRASMRMIWPYAINSLVLGDSTIAATNAMEQWIQVSTSATS